MKKILSMLMVLSVILVFSTPSYADYKPVEKLKKGITTMVKSPLEVRDHVKAEAKDGSFLPITLPAGFLKGTFYMAKQMVHGTLDVVTFPIDK